MDKKLIIMEPKLDKVIHSISKLQLKHHNHHKIIKPNKIKLLLQKPQILIKHQVKILKVKTVVVIQHQIKILKVQLVVIIQHKIVIIKLIN